MARVTLSLPDELAELLRVQLPQLNISGVLQEALRARLACDHRTLACSRCSAPVSRFSLEDDALGRFYKAAMWELRELVDEGGTVEGAARVLKRIAICHAVTEAEQYPLPRPSRQRREELRQPAQEVA
jgi:post-segregation antitoxin (ccd killing protein)